MKYFVCMPRGGISDILYVINFCLEYCLKYDRVLIIKYDNDGWIRDKLTKYITFNHPKIYNGDINEKLNELEKTTIFPNEIKELQNIKAKYINNNYHIIIGEKYICGKIELDKEYTEDTILYCGCYGGIPKMILKYIKITSIVLDVYYERLYNLNKGYISIHIRDTDRPTENIYDFINNINNKIVENECVFLASDNYKTIQYLKSLYGDKIHTLSKITDNNGKNMHYYYDKNLLTNEELVIDCLVDLLLLSSAKEYYYSNCKSNYSLTANYLYNNKDVLNNLLF